MNVGRCVIERRDGPTVCGLLFYRDAQHDSHLQWTADLGDPRQIVLRLYPSLETLAIVREHCSVLADSVLREVTKH